MMRLVEDIDSVHEIKEGFTEVKQVFLLNLWDSLVTLELISLIPLVGPPFHGPPSCEAPRQPTINP